MLPHSNPWLTLLIAALAWTATAILLWHLRRKL
jgi:hypothetical protein